MPGSHEAGTPHRVILELIATSHYGSGCALRRITRAVVFSIREFSVNGRYRCERCLRVDALAPSPAEIALLRPRAMPAILAG